jgi:citrate lyase beta subunit
MNQRSSNVPGGRVVAALEEAERNGQAAVTVDGKMADLADMPGSAGQFVEHAQMAVGPE